jgi:hypothetical protein
MMASGEGELQPTPGSPQPIAGEFGNPRWVPITTPYSLMGMTTQT